MFGVDWQWESLRKSGFRNARIAFYSRILIVVAGGQESMSMAPHASNLRAGTKMGNTEFVDTMIKDGLWDAFNG